MKEQKNRELVKAQMIDENVAVDAYCFLGYAKTGSLVQCWLGYGCNPTNVGSPDKQDDDILL